MRKVEPYFYEYKTYAKQRWIGRSLYDVFCTEFRGKPKEAYDRAFDEGSIYIVQNGVRFSIDRTYLVRDGDQIVHRAHRHEPVIDITGLCIVQDTIDYLIVNKPSTVPVHPAGRYHDNTLEQILIKDYKFEKLLLIHRLDVLTSGLLIIAKNYTFCQKVLELFRLNQMSKTYLARVIGKFSSDGVVDQKIECVHYPTTVHAVTPNGKYCKTLFQLFKYNADLNQSLVLCQPLTGRSHQIRVHLRWLDHPIVNDPIYAREQIWHNKDTLTFDEIFQRSETWMKEVAEQELMQVENRCNNCDSLIQDIIKHPGIYLHAWKLESLNEELPIKASSPLPRWAELI